MNDILAGNICSLLAMGTDALSGTRKKHKEILGIQILSQIFYGAGAIILKGYSGAVQNAVGILRNLTAMQSRKIKWLELLLIAAGAVLGIVCNNRGLLGWLPVLGNLEYSAAVFYLKDRERLLKGAFILNMAMFAVFNAAILNFAGAAANAVVIVTTAVFLLRDRPHAEEKENGRSAQTGEGDSHG